MRRVVPLVLAIVTILGVTPAAADEPDLVDECGITERSDRTALPWQDICAATFATEVTGHGEGQDDTVTVTVTIVLDGEVDLRTPTEYQAIFSDGDCDFWLMHTDDDALAAASDRVQVRCGPAESVPCDPPILEDLGFFCFTLPDPTYHDIGFSAEGRVVTLTFSTDGDAAGLPLSEGDVIDYFAVATTQQLVAGEGMWDSQCRVKDGAGSECESRFGDHAWTRALGHTITK